MTEMNVGDFAPDFDLPRDGGGSVSLSSCLGQKVVLYFYPRDDTAGCTIEALAFTAHIDGFSACNCKVLGVSKDTVISHDLFRGKHDLGIPLLSDADSDVCENYGVWQEKTMDGRTFMGIARTTFLIDERGKVSRIWRDIDVEGHVEEVLEAAREA
ncbi:peroxiredoxin [uncultured Ruegeria sp.]|uniref:peroxiredoxin n=1 Tax=uncultured Ruegeria sp. TaxID=259304 RepID=UPI00262E6E07|nr:peroxiredoxin [uncultured Ruegeria sp.]